MMTPLNDERSVSDVEDLEPRAAILVVDDDASVRTSLRRLLHALGYDTAGAASRAEALHKACELVPDLIIMDLHLSHECGIEVARAIKSAATLRRIPMVAMSAAGIDGEELRALFQRVLRKPFAATEMRSVLEDLVSVREPRHVPSYILSKRA